MEGQNYLGIYLSKRTATVVCLGLHGRVKKVEGCFTVSAQQQQGLEWAEITGQIAKECAARKWKFSEVRVALDCSMFMQHNIHSNFNDTKQIKATIRFDTEEALAADVDNIAIAFKITSSDENGSLLTVFTIEKQILSEIIVSLQSNKLDAVTIEPDVNCLSRFIEQNIPISEEAHPFFGMLSMDRGYFIVPVFSDSQKYTIFRTFLVGSNQNRNQLLTREIPLTTALIEADSPVNCLKVFDSTSPLNPLELSEKLCMEVEVIDIAACGDVEPRETEDCDDMVAFSIAYGAGLAHTDRKQVVNFREDFLPYLGKKKRMQKILKIASCITVVVFIVLGLYFQLRLFQKNKPRKLLIDKFNSQYSAVMFGKAPPQKKNPVGKLSRELNRIRDIKSGKLAATGQESVSAKMTLILSAFNKCASNTKLSIDRVSITSKSINITGDTSSRKNTLKLFDEIKKSGLEIVGNRIDSKGGRDVFAITVATKQ